MGAAYGDDKLSPANLRHLASRGKNWMNKDIIYLFRLLQKDIKNANYMNIIIFSPSLRHTPVSLQHFHFSIHPWLPASSLLFPIPASFRISENSLISLCDDCLNEVNTTCTEHLLLSKLNTCIYKCTMSHIILTNQSDGLLPYCHLQIITIIVVVLVWQ